jgi:hypothetical protein
MAACCSSISLLNRANRCHVLRSRGWTGNAKPLTIRVVADHDSPPFFLPFRGSVSKRVGDCVLAESCLRHEALNLFSERYVAWGAHSSSVSRIDRLPEATAGLSKQGETPAF